MDSGVLWIGELSLYSSMKSDSISNWQVLLDLWGSILPRAYMGLRLEGCAKSPSGFCHMWGSLFKHDVITEMSPKFSIRQGWGGLPRCFFWHVSGCCCFCPFCLSIGGEFPLILRRVASVLLDFWWEGCLQRKKNAKIMEDTWVFTSAQQSRNECPLLPLSPAW